MSYDVLPKFTTENMFVTNSQMTTPPLKARSRGRFLASTGLLLMMGPLVGFFITIFGMIQSYGNLASGGPTSEELGRQIGLSMKVTMWGFGAGIVGSTLVTVAVMALGNRELWIYRNGLVLAVIMALAMGVFGIVFGGGLFALLLIKRGEFKALDIHLQNKS
jgi:MotA/TolQ/ExbB proton channel family